jgi:hypothetical protein
MADFVDDFLNELTSAKPTINSQYQTPGEYEWEVQKIILKPGRFIMERKCLSSKSTGEINRFTKEPYVPNPEGSYVSYIVTYNPQDDKSPGRGNVMAALCGVFGFPAEFFQKPAGKALLKKLMADENAAAGIKVKDVAFNKPQKVDPNKDFTHHRWTTDPEQKAKADALLKKLAEQEAAQAKAATSL